MIDLTEVLGAVIVLVISLIAYKLIPYIKANTTEKEFEQMQMWVKIAVQAAEMIFKESGLGKEKKQYVIDFLKAKGFTIDLDKLDAMIESAVLEMNRNK